MNAARNETRDASATLTHEMERLLFHEAKLIDGRRFEAWLELFDDDAHYVVPNASPDAQPGHHGFIILEDKRGMAERIRRLQHPMALTQVPPPRTRHLISNVLVEEASEAELVVASNQVVYVARLGKQAQYVGGWEHRLRRRGEGWSIIKKTVDLITSDQAMSQIPVL